MKTVLKPFQVIYCIYAYLTFAFFLLAGFIYALFVSLVFGQKGHKAVFAYYKAWSVTWFFMTGIRMSKTGTENLAATPCIIAGNHSTHLDLLVAVYMLPLKTKALAKIEIRKIPLMGYMFSVVSVFVDRKNKESRGKSIREMHHKLREGFSIFMYPEGTRNRTSDPLKEFYDGAFRIAIETQQPILPVCTINGRGIWPVHTIWMRPGWMRIIYLPAFDTKGMTEKDVPELKAKVFAAMENCLLLNDPAFKSRS